MPGHRLACSSSWALSELKLSRFFDATALATLPTISAPAAPSLRDIFFLERALPYMRAHYPTRQKCLTPSGESSFSLCCEQLSISDDDERSFHEKESLNFGWTVDELKRRIDASLYQRLPLSEVRELAGRNALIVAEGSSDARGWSCDALLR